MKVILWTICLSLWTAVRAFSQEAGFERSVLFLTGASGMEELDEEELERFHALQARPVRINLASKGRLSSTGLMTRYQIASLRDYCARNGDVLSAGELALVDGFGEETAEALKPFISFETSTVPGRSSLERQDLETELNCRATAKENGQNADWSAAAKFRTGSPDGWELAFASKSPYGDHSWPPESVSGSAVIYGRSWLDKLVLGDFNARFGQGLLLWSGFSLSGFSSAGSFAKHPSGLAPAWTLSPESVHRGCAATFSFRRSALTAFWDTGECTGANLTVFSERGQYGMTVLSAGLASVDFRSSAGHWDFFGECAGALSAKHLSYAAGLSYNPAYQVKLSLLVRDYPADFPSEWAGAPRSSTKSSDERGVAFGLDLKSLTFTADAAFHPSKGSSQHKALLKYERRLTDILSFAVRATSRYRPEDSFPWRNETRFESELSVPGGLTFKSYLDLCRCERVSLLGFCEASFRRESSNRVFTTDLRGTAFKADSWNDRIYVYERDVPGAFSVPAYYGRGWSVSALTSLKWRRNCLGLRFSMTEYPGMTEKKPGKAELKFQFRIIW